MSFKYEVKSFAMFTMSFLESWNEQILIAKAVSNRKGGGLTINLAYNSECI